MKVFAGGIATETNMFAPTPTSLEDFAIRRGAMAGAGSASAAFDLYEVWGRRITARGDEFVSSLMAFAQPGGLTTKSAYESLRNELLADLREAIPVDMVLLMLHGAMVAEGYDDCEEDIIRCVRDVVGPEVTIGVELDLHCHLSHAKIAAADVVITYKEYPHVDVNDRAVELLTLATGARQRTIRPTMALFECRMVGLYPTNKEPLRSFVGLMQQAERTSGILSVSFAHGYQFADLPHVGAKMLVVTDNNPELANKVAEEFGMRIHGLRRHIGFESISLSIDAAFSKALASAVRPVVVADQSDNVGAGAPGDATYALEWLLANHVQEAAVAILYDPQVVKIAHRAGAGATVQVRLGGKMGSASGNPLDVTATVLSTRTNHYHSLPQETGEPLTFALGDVAALRCAGVDVVVSSERCQCYSSAIFDDMAIDPTGKRLLVPKSTQHFYGSFSRLSREIIYMAAPGACAPDPRLLRHRHLNTSRMYPWNESPFGIESNLSGGTS